MTTKLTPTEEAANREIQKTIDQQNLLDIQHIINLHHHGYKIGPIKIERRKMRSSDQRLLFLGFLGTFLLSFGFVAIPSIIPIFVGATPYLMGISLIGIQFAAWRGIRLDDWFSVIYLASYVLVIFISLPAIIADATLPPLMASAVIVSISLAIFLNLAFTIYVLHLNITYPKRIYA